MVNTVRSCAFLFGILSLVAFSAVCTRPAGFSDVEARQVKPREIEPAQTKRQAPAAVETPTDERPAPPHHSSPDGEREHGDTDTRVKPTEPAVETAISPSVVDPNEPAYAIALKFEPGETTYYTIENTFVDSGGVPPLLTFTTTAKDRRFIIQRVDAPATQTASNPSHRPPASVTWECDRYDVREEGMKDDLAYDSLRLLYPPPRLRALGGIPGSTSTFLIDGVTGETSRVRTRLAPIEGSTTRAKLSGTAAKAQLTVNNLKSLLDDLGCLYLPGSPKRVGEAWTVERRETHKSFGTVLTAITCTLRSARKEGDSEVANIDITSVISLEAKAEQENRGKPTSQPGRKLPKSGKSRNYRLDRKACAGRVKLDLTHGLIIEMDLHRELEFVADLESSGASSMVTEIRKGERHDLRVRGSRTAPRHPEIVGGRKAPVIPPDEKKPPPSRRASGRAKSTTQSSRPATSRRATSRPDRPYSRVNRKQPTTQPAGGRDADKQRVIDRKPPDARTTSRPSRRRSSPGGFRGKQKSRPHSRSTTQPVTSKCTSPLFVQGEWAGCAPCDITLQWGGQSSPIVCETSRDRRAIAAWNGSFGELRRRSDDSKRHECRFQ
ncbi:MAG: hypothetical protein ABII12_05095 [Planctomycetota bacterium]